MRIAIPVDEKSIKTSVCQSFGRAPYFLIYDTDSKESKFIDNSAAASQGGAGIKAAQNVVDTEVSALLTPRCGENAAEVINAANIKIYRTTDASVLQYHSLYNSMFSPLLPYLPIPMSSLCRPCR